MEAPKHKKKKVTRDLETIHAKRDANLKQNQADYPNKPIRKLSEEDLAKWVRDHPHIPPFGSRHDVWNGRALMTSGGLQRKDLEINHKGYLVSRYASKRAMERMKNQGDDWVLKKNDKCSKATKKIHTLHKKHSEAKKARESRARKKIIRTLSDLYKTKVKLSPQIFLFS